MSNLPILLAEAPIVAENMQKFGGSFISNLGRALMHADLTNMRKIYDTWPNEWRKYLELAHPSNPSATKGAENDQD